MGYPERLGLPCWEQAQVDKVISTQAQTSPQSASFFLAAHSPFEKIVDAKGAGRLLGEEDVFAELFSGSRREVQAFVRGAPGTGKSHLIRWLKLRAEYAANHNESGLNEYKLVLVTRGNGSLKDALRQIVAQLGAEFREHAKHVQGAIDTLSDVTARKKLASELAIEVESRRTDRGLDPLPRDLRHLGQALRSSGFGQWLQEDGGVIARVIQRLTHPSTVEQRDQEVLPQFEPQYLLPEAKHLRPTNNSEEVIDFVEDLKQDEGLAKRAAEALNTALGNAIGELTNLRSSDLLEIFTDIRRTLHQQKKRLAVFIEDVSVTSLDREIVNTFEPRPDDRLCRMVAVLGITQNSWDHHLPGNQTQRGTHIFDVGDAANSWAINAKEVARFAARYLNAVRLPSKDVDSVARERFAGDVRRSQCSGCPRREECHRIFGKVDLGKDVSIGLFPFSLRAPHAMLGTLSERFYLSQRGLLDGVLRPALEQSFPAYTSGEFPQTTNFKVERNVPVFWSIFEGKYCGGGAWDESHRNRLKFLAQYWVDASGVEDLASQMQPLLKPFGFPQFSSTPRDQGQKKPGPEARPAPKEPQRKERDKELDNLVNALEEWKGGANLRSDNKFRELVEVFLKTSIRWAEERGTPIGVAREFVRGTRFPDIVGQLQRPGGSFFVQIKRDAESHKMLQALLMFTHTGAGTWSFEHGESHKRNLSRWLRKHKISVVNELKPKPPTLAQQALDCAAQVLALSAILRDRKSFSGRPSEDIGRLLSPGWDMASRPASLSSGVEGITEDLETKHQALRDLIVQELGAGQGDASPKDFIDPVPLMKILERFTKKVEITLPPSSIKEKYWQPRFDAVSDLGSCRKLDDTIEEEKDAVAKSIKTIRAFERDCGVEQGDADQALKACLKQLMEVVQLQRKPDAIPLGATPFDDALAPERIQGDTDRWATCLTEAETVVKSRTASDALTFEPRPLKQLEEFVSHARKYLELVDRELCDKEAEFARGGATNCDELLEGLEELSNSAEKSAGRSKRRRD